MSKNKNTSPFTPSSTPETPPDNEEVLETTQTPRSFVGSLINRARFIGAHANLAATDAFGRAREWAGNNKSAAVTIGLGVVAAGMASRFGIMPWVEHDSDTLTSTIDMQNSPTTVTFDDITPVNVSKPLHDSGNLAPLTSIEMGKFNTETDQATGYLNGTLWKELAEEAQNHGVHLTDEQLASLTSRTLEANGIEDATQLQIGQQLDIPADVSQELGSGIGKPDAGAPLPPGQPGGTPPESGPTPGPSPQPAPYEVNHPVEKEGASESNLEKIWRLTGGKKVEYLYNTTTSNIGFDHLSASEKNGLAYFSGIGLTGLYVAHRLKNRQNPDRSTPSPQPAPESRNDPDHSSQPNTEPQPHAPLRGGIESGILPDWPGDESNIHLDRTIYENWRQQALEGRRAHLEIYLEKLEQENYDHTNDTRLQLSREINIIRSVIMGRGEHRLPPSRQAAMSFKDLPPVNRSMAIQSYDDTAEYLRDDAYEMGRAIMEFYKGRTQEELGRERIELMRQLEESLMTEYTSGDSSRSLNHRQGVRTLAELDFVLERLAMPDSRT